LIHSGNRTSVDQCTPDEISRHFDFADFKPCENDRSGPQSKAVKPEAAEAAPSLSDAFVVPLKDRRALRKREGCRNGFELPGLSGSMGDCQEGCQKCEGWCSHYQSRQKGALPRDSVRLCRRKQSPAAPPRRRGGPHSQSGRAAAYHTARRWKSKEPCSGFSGARGNMRVFA
jgi:hypothetical protein